MSRLRILVLGPGCNPEQVSMPYVTYSHAAALAQLHDVTLVVRARVEAPVRRAGAPFRAVEAIQMPLLERLHGWVFRRILRGNYNTQWLTFISYPLAVAFEWHAWRRFRHRIDAGEFDVVFRVEPMSPVLPSPFGWFLRRSRIPFVLGPLNGGLPWPGGFRQLAGGKERVSAFRNLYRRLPFARSTYRFARAIIAASSQTYSEFAGYGQKVFFVPEPGISASLCFRDSAAAGRGDTLDLLFVGGLVARKACDLALRAAAGLLRSGSARFTIIGDGPDRNKLETMAQELGVADRVDFLGWLAHAAVLDHMRAADVFLFPTLRDNGAGVVFEALASGAVPVVVDFGGPGDIVNERVGAKVPLTNEADVTAQLGEALERLERDRNLLGQMRQNGMAYARERLTWEAKAQDTTRVLEWVTGRGPRPDLPPPKVIARDRRPGRPRSRAAGAEGTG